MPTCKDCTESVFQEPLPGMVEIGHMPKGGECRLRFVLILENTPACDSFKRPTPPCTCEPLNDLFSSAAKICVCQAQHILEKRLIWNPAIWHKNTPDAERLYPAHSVGAYRPELITA